MRSSSRKCIVQVGGLKDYEIPIHLTYCIGKCVPIGEWSKRMHMLRSRRRKKAHKELNFLPPQRLFRHKSVNNIRHFDSSQFDYSKILLWNVSGNILKMISQDLKGESGFSSPNEKNLLCRHMIYSRTCEQYVVSWHVRACKMATGRNAPHEVEKVHSECRINSESYDRGNNALWSALIIIGK